jgi:subtilisin family serine protease
MGNNRNGVSGVAWKTSMMALKIFSDGGTGATERDIAAAIRYAVNAGARVSNNSWGAYSGGFGATLYNAIDYARQRDHVFVVAAGNDGVNNDLSFLRPYPASFDLPNIVTVAATDEYGDLAYFSNYGAASVDLAAPGVSILSTYLDGRYAYLSGTSMAAPLVTGAAALVLSEDPSLNYAQVKTRILGNVDRYDMLIGTSLTGGALNLSRTITAVSLANAQAPDDDDDDRRRSRRRDASNAQVAWLWDEVAVVAARERLHARGFDRFEI